MLKLSISKKKSLNNYIIYYLIGVLHIFWHIFNYNFQIIHSYVAYPTGCDGHEHLMLKSIGCIYIYIFGHGRDTMDENMDVRFGEY